MKTAVLAVALCAALLTGGAAAQTAGHSVSDLMERVRTAETQGRFEQALELVSQAQERARQTGETRLAGALNHTRAGLLLSLNRLEEAERSARLAMRQLSEATGASVFTGVAVARLGGSLHRQGLFLEAEDYFVVFEQLTEAAANSPDVMGFARVRAMNLAALERFSQARDLLLGRVVKVPSAEQASALSDVLEIDVMAEDIPRAKEVMAQLDALDLKDPGLRARVSFQEARLLWLTQEFGAADAALDDLVEQSGAGTDGWRAALYHMSGTSKMARGLTDTGRQRFLRAQALLERDGVTAGLEMANVLSGLSTAETRSGKLELSLRYLEDAVLAAQSAVGAEALPAVALHIELAMRLIEAGLLDQAHAALTDIELRVDGLDLASPRTRRVRIQVGLALAAYGAATDDAAAQLETLGALVETIEMMDGPASQWLATPLTDYARLLNEAGQFERAQAAAKRAVDLRVTYNAVGPSKLAPALHQQAMAEEKLGAPERALGTITRAVDLLALYSGRLLASDNRQALEDELRERSAILHFAARVAYHQDDLGLLSTSLQLANTTATEAAAVSMARKLARDDTARAQLLSERETVLADLRALQSAAQVDQTRVAQAFGALEAINKRMSAAFPDTALIAGAEILTLRETQALLAKDEAAFLALPTPTGTYSMLIGRGFVTAAHDKTTDVQLAELVGAIRRGVDPLGRLLDADGLTLSAGHLHAAYEVLLARFEGQLREVQHIIQVPSGALQSLPLGLLLTEPWQRLDLDTLADAPWFIRQMAISVVPSLRVFGSVRSAERTAPPMAYLGVGDPILAGYDAATRGAAGLALPSALVENLAALPETRDEILAASAVAQEAAILFGAEAREDRLKSMDLSRYGVLHFATHGLLATETNSFATGVLEPALVLTPPDVATPNDDGLLTSSEIATLELNAALVILSACNTASPSGLATADGFSGLAKAFLTAGADTLVVSHWAVMSKPAQELIVHLFETRQGRGTRKTAEALRRASLAMIDRVPDAAIPVPAHPVAWAPFVAVGGTAL